MAGMCTLLHNVVLDGRGTAAPAEMWHALRRGGKAFKGRCARASCTAHAQRCCTTQHPHLPPYVILQVKRALGGRSVAQLAHAVRDAQAAWSRWAVGLQWLVLAGEALGLQSIGGWSCSAHRWAVVMQLLRRSLQIAVHLVARLAARLPPACIASYSLPTSPTPASHSMHARPLSHVSCLPWTHFGGQTAVCFHMFPPEDFRPWKLLEEALRPSFAAGPLEQLLAQVDKELRRDGKLSAEAVGQLAAALRQRAACVWGGTEAAAEQLAGLAAVEAGQEEAAEEQDAEGSGQQQQAQQEQAEEQQSAEEQAAEAPAAKKQKRDVFHSKHSRKQALLSKAAEKSSKKCSSAAAAAAAKGKQAAAPGARLAAWLSPAVRALLAEPPTKLPGGWRCVGKEAVCQSSVGNRACSGPCTRLLQLRRKAAAPHFSSLHALQAPSSSLARTLHRWTALQRSRARWVLAAAVWLTVGQWTAGRGDLARACPGRPLAGLLLPIHLRHTSRAFGAGKLPPCAVPKSASISPPNKAFTPSVAGAAPGADRAPPLPARAA